MTYFLAKHNHLDHYSCFLLYVDIVNWFAIAYPLLIFNWCGREESNINKHSKRKTFILAQSKHMHASTTNIYHVSFSFQIFQSYFCSQYVCIFDSFLNLQQHKQIQWLVHRLKTEILCFLLMHQLFKLVNSFKLYMQFFIVS